MSFKFKYLLNRNFKLKFVWYLLNLWQEFENKCDVIIFE